jgi:hypothetical protein
MTDQTFEAPTSDEPANRRNLVIAGGAAGLLVLAGAGFLLLSGGSSGSTTSVANSLPRAPLVVKSATSPKRATATAIKLPAASAVRVGRDPFLALYVAPVAPAAGSTSPSGSTSTTTSGSTSTGSTTPTTAPATGASYALKLVSVKSDPGGAKFFTFTYGTTTKVVLPAQRFGKFGELVVLTYVKDAKGTVLGAVIQVGDDNPIEVPIGAKVTVL